MKGRWMLGMFAGLLLSGASAQAGQVRIVVKLLSTHCGNTEDVTGADELYAVSLFSAGSKETMQAGLSSKLNINDDQAFDPWPAPHVLYDGVVDDTQTLTGGIRFFDEDFAKDWSQRPQWLDGLVGKGASALQSSGNPKAVIAGTVLDYAYKGFGWVASMDADDLLGARDMTISPSGPASEITNFKFHRDDWTGYSSWNYNALIAIERYPVKTPVPPPPPPPATTTQSHTAVWVKGSGQKTAGLFLQPFDFFDTKRSAHANGGLGLTFLQSVSGQEGVRVNARWEAGQPPQRSTFGKTYDEYRKLYDVLWTQGWRLRLLDAYPSPFWGSTLYNAVWEKRGGAEVQFYEMPFGEVGQQDARLAAQGMMLDMLQAVPTAQGLRWNAVWKPRKGNQPWVMGWTYENYRKKYDALWPQGYRLKHLQAYRLPDGGVRYDAIWEQSTRPELQFYGATRTDFQKKNAELSQQGWQLKILNTH